MKILCTICARGGYKGIKNKNINKINGKELIFYNKKKKKKSKLFEDIAVSSDSKKILNIAKKYSITNIFLRKKKYSTNIAPKINAIKNCLDQMEKKRNIKYDIICDLDVTSPLRLVSDVLNAYKVFIKNNCPNLISVNYSRRNPYFNMVEFKNMKLQISKGMQKYTARQQVPKVFDINASIYFWKRDFLLKSNKIINKKTSIFIMPFERSIDIDTREDLKIVKLLMKKK